MVRWWEGKKWGRCPARLYIACLWLLVPCFLACPYCLTAESTLPAFLLQSKLVFTSITLHVFGKRCSGPNSFSFRASFARSDFSRFCRDCVLFLILLIILENASKGLVVALRVFSNAWQLIFMERHDLLKPIWFLCLGVIFLYIRKIPFLGVELVLSCFLKINLTLLISCWSHWGMRGYSSAEELLKAVPSYRSLFMTAKGALAKKLMYSTYVFSIVYRFEMRTT